MNLINIFSYYPGIESGLGLLPGAGNAIRSLWQNISLAWNHVASTFDIQQLIQKGEFQAPPVVSISTKLTSDGRILCLTEKATFITPAVI